MQAAKQLQRQNFGRIHDAPYLSLTGELWGVFRELLKEKWSWYKESVLHVQISSAGFNSGWTRSTYKTSNIILMIFTNKNEQKLKLTCSGNKVDENKIVFSHATDKALNWQEWKLLNSVVGS